MDDNTRSVLVLFITTASTAVIAWLKTRETRKYLETVNRVKRRKSEEPVDEDDAKRMIEGDE